MRTRSQASPRKTIAGKRKKRDDFPALDAGAGSKRRRLQNRCDQEVATSHSSAHTDSGKGLFSASAQKVIFKKAKKGDKSSPDDDGARGKQRRVQAPDQEIARSPSGTEGGETPCFSFLARTECEDEITSQSHAGGKTSTVILDTANSQFEEYILALPSKVVKSSASVSSKRGRKDRLHTASQHGEVSTQVESIGFERNVHIQSNCNDPIPLPEDRHQIVETAILLQELADTQLQSEKGHHNEATRVLSEEGAAKHLEIFLRKGEFSGIDNYHESDSHPASCADFTKGKKGGLRSHSAQKNKKNKEASSVPMPLKLKNRGMSAASSRWRHLMQRIIKAQRCPGSIDDRIQVPQSGVDHRQDSFSVEKERTRVENSQVFETQSVPKKRKRPVGHDPSATGKRLVVRRKQQKTDIQLRRLLRQMKTWLTQAKFPQAPETNDQSNDNMGETFIMTEEKRNSFAQTMVKSCQQNPHMRTIFLQSMMTLTMSGLMHAAASSLLQEESCEQAQTLMDAWAEFKEQNTTTRTSPMNLLNAVNQLHEQRGDLSTKLHTSEGLFELKRVDEKTWKLKLPTLSEPKPNEKLPEPKPQLGAE